MQAASAARDSTVGKDKNGSDVIKAFLDFSGDTLLVKSGLLKTSSIDQSRYVEDANLGKGSCLLIIPKKSQKLTTMPFLLVSS